MATTIEKTADDRIIMNVDPDSVFKDRGVLDAAVFICAMLNKRKRSPAVREALINTLRAVGTLLVANDPDMKGVMKLLDKDARENAKLDDAPSFFKPDESGSRQLKKPVKRKKAVGRR